MATFNDPTDNIESELGTNDAVKVTKTSLKFGPLTIMRGASVPSNSVGRNGDLFLLDDTAGPDKRLQTAQSPSVTGVYQKVPSSVPSGPVVYDTATNGVELTAGGGFDLNGVTVTIAPSDGLPDVATAITTVLASETPPVTATANPTLLTGTPGGVSAPGDAIDITFDVSTTVSIPLNAPHTAAQAVADINAAAIPGATASLVGGAVQIEIADGGDATLTDNSGTPTATLGPFTTAGGNLTITETVGDTGLTFTNISGDAAALNLVDQPASPTVPGGTWTPLGSGGGGLQQVLDDGADTSLVSPVPILNFIGTTIGGDPVDIQVEAGSAPGQVDITIGDPPPWSSNWNTNNGSTGDQSVSEAALGIVDTYISQPTSPGVPFEDTLSGAVNRATNNGLWTFTTPGGVTGFGGDSTMQVEVINGSGAVIYSGVTSALTGDGTFPAGANASATLAGSIPDAGGPELVANASVDVDISSILPAGGPARVRITHTVNSSSANPTSLGGSPFVYEQPAGATGLVFYDAGPTPPSLTGVPIITESTQVTKFLSGVEYYTVSSSFDVQQLQINELNNATIATIANGGAVRLDGTEYNLPFLFSSPAGPGSTPGEFTGWNDTYNTTPVQYDETAWAIAPSPYRYVGPTANITLSVADAWDVSSGTPTADADIAIDTFGVNSTDLVEPFDDEDRRQDSGFNGGASTGNWDSTVDLVANQAMVYGGQLIVPDQAAYIRIDGPNSVFGGDFAGTFNPDPNPGGQPDYSAFGAPVNYYRTFPGFPGGSTPSAIMTVTGSFATSLLGDLQTGDLEIFIRKVSGGSPAPIGNSGPASPPIWLHGSSAYNFATFDDGNTQTNAGATARTGVSGNNVDFTFGGFSAGPNGIHVHIRINNPAIALDGVAITF